MENSGRGGLPPDSGDSGSGKPQKVGKKRWNWRKKKKRHNSSLTGKNVAPRDAETSEHTANTENNANGAILIARPQSSDRRVAANTDTASNQIVQSEPVAPRRRRRRRRNKNRQQGSQFDPAGGNGASAGEHRHRRQAMQPEKPVSFSTANIGDHQQLPRMPPTNSRKEHWRGRKPANCHKSPRTFYAALDLGTNNCRLLVALPQASGRFRVVDAYSRIVRLGEGLASSGRLSDAAMDRTMVALRDCSEKLANRDRTRIRLIATEACRRAENGQHFLNRVLQETGLELEIVDRATEARLAVSGCGSLVDRNADGVVLFDIGGGSSELALLDVSKKRSRRISDHIASWESMPLGVVTLSEKFGGKHVTPSVFEDMVADVTTMLQQFEGRNVLAHSVGSRRFHLLGTSGTVTTLAGVHLNLRRYDRRRVDGAWLSNREVDAMIKKILHMSFEDRVNNPCIGADRADLVLAGCAILEAIRRFWPAPRLRVADRGLREGLLTEMMAEDGVWKRNRKKPKRPAALNNGGKVQ